MTNPFHSATDWGAAKISFAASKCISICDGSPRNIHTFLRLESVCGGCRSKCWMAHLHLMTGGEFDVRSADVWITLDLALRNIKLSGIDVCGVNCYFERSNLKDINVSICQCFFSSLYLHVCGEESIFCGIKRWNKLRQTWNKKGTREENPCGRRARAGSRCVLSLHVAAIDWFSTSSTPNPVAIFSITAALVPTQSQQNLKKQNKTINWNPQNPFLLTLKRSQFSNAMGKKID